MDVRCHTDTSIENAVIAILFGSLDERGAVTVWQSASSELDQTRPSLAVDLSEVDLITSAGIGTLVRLFHRVQSLGGSLALYGASPRVHEVIESVMLVDILNLCGTLEEARGRMKG